MDTILFVVLTLLPLAALLFYKLDRKRHAKDEAQFAALCERLGLTQSAVPAIGSFHYEGNWRGSRVILGDYRGENTRSYSTWWLEDGIQVFMEVGGLPGVSWWVDLSQSPPELHGKGEGREKLTALLTPEVLAATEWSRHARSIRLFPIEMRTRGSILELLLTFQSGWSGLTLHALLPLDLAEENLRKSLNQLAVLRDALRQAQE